ncbi:MAG: rhodanese-like domain-containing protein [Pseudomonadota bacterium]
MSHRTLWIGLSAGLLASAACSDKPGKDSDERSSPSPLLMPRLAAADTAPSAAQSLSLVRDLSPAEVASLIETGDVRVIDVRTDEEVAQGVLPGAEHIAMSEFDPAAVATSDSRPILLYCRSGRRSRVVGEALVEHTGEPAQHLDGGILAWAEAGYPIEQP